MAIRPTSNWKFYCFSLLLLSSIMCYVVVIFPGTLLPTSFYNQGVAYRSYPCDIVLESERALPTPSTRENFGQTNCSCAGENWGDENSMLPIVQEPISREDPARASNRSIHVVPKNGKTLMNDSLTGSLWDFKEMGDQQLYLYENYLKREWHHNFTNAAKLRLELASYRSVLGDNSKIILHQKNVRLKEKVKFVFNGKPKIITSEIYHHLPKINPYSSKRFKSCAVIGNSGLLINSSCGASVDQHDYVFRCNLAPLEPFKKDAGMKSDFITMNPSLVDRNYKGLKSSEDNKAFTADISKYDGLLWVPCFGFSTMFPLAYKVLTAYKGTKPRLVCGYPTHFKAAADFWEERGMNKRLSTGFYLVTTAIQLCDEVHIYGFWPFSARYTDERADVPYHYFDDLGFHVAKSTHSMDREFNVLLQLHTLGVVHLNVGTCS